MALLLVCLFQQQRDVASVKAVPLAELHLTLQDLQVHVANLRVTLLHGSTMNKAKNHYKHLLKHICEDSYIRSTLLGRLLSKMLDYLLTNSMRYSKLMES
jgi:hypothetical protein